MLGPPAVKVLNGILYLCLNLCECKVFLFNHKFDGRLDKLKQICDGIVIFVLVGSASFFWRNPIKWRHSL